MRMKSILRTNLYPRNNYVNKEGKTPVMLRIYLNNEHLSLRPMGIAVVQTQWDNVNEKIKERTTEALSINLHYLRPPEGFTLTLRAGLG